MPSHPLAAKNGYIYEHRLIAEKVLGRYMKAKEQIHHVDYICPKNIVICEDAAYHNLIEARTRALYTCGNPNYRPCQFCKRYDSVNNMYKNNRSHYHLQCKNEYQNKRIKGRTCYWPEK